MKRNKIVKVSLSEQEYEKLVATATIASVSPSEFLRDVVKSQVPRFIPSLPQADRAGILAVEAKKEGMNALAKKHCNGG